MPICFGKSKLQKIGFVHIPKCAGTSIEVALAIAEKYPEIGVSPTRTTPDISSLFGGGLQHLTVREITQHYNKIWDQLDFTFSVIRSPLDRFLSHFMWKYYRFSKDLPSDRELLENLRTHTFYVEKISNEIALFNDPFEGMEYCESDLNSIHLNNIDRHIIPQCCFIFNKGAVPLDYLFSMDDLLALERFLHQKGVLQKPFEQRMKGSLHKKLRSMLSHELIEIIHKIYLHDDNLYDQVTKLSNDDKRPYSLGHEIFEENFLNADRVVSQRKLRSVSIGNTENIPKKIWMFWHQGWDQAPNLITECKNSWIEKNQDWEIILLSKDNLSNYLQLPDVYLNQLQLTHASFSDVLRIHLLTKYGGVWVDATTWCAKSLDKWIENVASKRGFFAYSKPAPDRPIASWFLAAKKNNYIVRKFQNAVDILWQEFTQKGDIVFDRLFNISNVNALMLREKMSNSHYSADSNLSCKYYSSEHLTSAPKSKYYFWFHSTFGALLEIDPKFADIWHEGPDISADAPHYLQRLGLLNPTTPEAEIHISTVMTNVIKLNRRIDIPDNVSGTVIGSLFNS